MHKTAVLFDLDDTLYAYAPCNDAGLRAAHEMLRGVVDVDMPRFAELHDEARLALKRELPNQASAHNRLLFFKRIVEALLGRPNAALTLALHRAYWDAFHRAMTLNPAARSVLGRLAASRKLALVTNQTAEAQLGKVRALGIDEYFAAIVISEEAGAEKPDPAIFRLALDRLHARPEDAVMIGNEPDGDIAGARAAGIATIFTLEYHPNAPDQIELAGGADHMIAHLAEVLEILDAPGEAGGTAAEP